MSLAQPAVLESKSIPKRIKEFLGMDKNSGDDFPSMDEIVSTWISTTEAANELGISRQAVHDAVQRWQDDPANPQSIRAIRIRREWFLDPESVKQYPRRYSNP